MQKYSPYMHWAKTMQTAECNLATSGVAGFPAAELPFDWSELEINSGHKYGYPPLKRAIAAKAGVDPDCVVEAAGTSFANYLAMATLLKPGDRVLIEHPTYPLLWEAAENLGATVGRFDRREECGFALDPQEVQSAVTPNTRLIVITNLHNPSGALAGTAELAAVADLARSVGAHLSVDEVYLDAAYEQAPRTAFHLGRHVVVTSSLTKVYGLSGLRCGWILAEPGLAREMWQLNNLFGVNLNHPGEQLSAAAFEYLNAIRERARRVVEADRAVLTPFLEQRSELAAAPTRVGTTSFPRLKDRPVGPFLERLRAQYGTSAVPGHFFGMPDHFRIGMGTNTAMFAEGLRRIGCLLDEA